MPHPNKVNNEVRLENQPKTSLPELLTLMYPNPPPRSNVGTKPNQGVQYYQQI